MLQQNVRFITWLHVDDLMAWNYQIINIDSFPALSYIYIYIYNKKKSKNITFELSRMVTSNARSSYGPAVEF